MTHDELLARLDDFYPKESLIFKALRAVVEIKSEDARMAKFKAQDFQDGWDACLEAVLQAIEGEVK